MSRHPNFKRIIDCGPDETHLYQERMCPVCCTVFCYECSSESDEEVAVLNEDESLIMICPGCGFKFDVSELDPDSNDELSTIDADDAFTDDFDDDCFDDEDPDLFPDEED